jgi:hypothetical protein
MNHRIATMILPNFLVIGAYKSGTTSLHNYLKQHPDIFIPEVKEPNYFAFLDAQKPTNNPAYKNSIKTAEGYANLFAKAKFKKAIGEVSPEYMSNSASSAKAINSQLPTIKLIGILRNPIERAYSDYLMYFHKGIDKESHFINALSKQNERMNRGDPTGFYISTGFYGKQLIPYYELFPKEQIKIILFEDLVNNPYSLLRELFLFLDVDPDFCPTELSKHNPSGIPKNAFAKFILNNQHYIRIILRPILFNGVRNILRRHKKDLLDKPAIPVEAKSKLQKIYKDDVHQLETLIGRDLSHWIK